MKEVRMNEGANDYVHTYKQVNILSVNINYHPFCLKIYLRINDQK